MSAATHLAQYNISVAEARAFILANMTHPAVIYNVAVQYHVTAEMLAEIYGGVTSNDVVYFFLLQGLDGTALIADTPADAVIMRGTSAGSITGLSAIEVDLPVALRISDLQTLSNYASSSGMFGSGATVVSMAQTGDPTGYTSYIRIAPGSGTTFQAGTTALSITAYDGTGMVRKVACALPAVHLLGTAGNDGYVSTVSDELLDLSLGGADTVTLRAPPNQGDDWVYNFTPGAGLNADVLDLRAFSLSRGVADAQPGSATLQAYATTSTAAIDVSNQVVLVTNPGSMIDRIGDVVNLFGADKPFQMTANSRAVLLVFETADNFEDVYYVANDSTAAVTSLEVWDLGQLELNGQYVAGAGTYVDGSFVAGNFLL